MRLIQGKRDAEIHYSDDPVAVALPDRTEVVLLFLVLAPAGVAGTQGPGRQELIFEAFLGRAIVQRGDLSHRAQDLRLLGR